MIAVTPAGSHETWLRWPRISKSGWDRVEQVVGEEPEVHRDPRHHAAPVRAQQRAVVAGLDLGQVLDPLLDAVGDPVQDRGALGRRQSPPRPGTRPCAAATAASTSAGAAAAHLGDHLAVDRRDVVERLGARDPLAADPVPGVDVDARDGRCGSSACLRGGRTCRGPARADGLERRPRTAISFGYKRYWSGPGGVKDVRQTAHRRYRRASPPLPRRIATGRSRTARTLSEGVLRAGGEPLTVHPWAPDGVVSTEDEVGTAAGFRGRRAASRGRRRLADAVRRAGRQRPRSTTSTTSRTPSTWPSPGGRSGRGVPLLAVCRGWQLVNVALGGDLEQHMAEPHRARRAPGGRRAGTRCSPTRSARRCAVSCFHHQRVRRLGVRAACRSAYAADGTVEGAVLPAARRLVPRGPVAPGGHRRQRPRPARALRGAGRRAAATGRQPCSTRLTTVRSDRASSSLAVVVEVGRDPGLDAR